MSPGNGTESNAEHRSMIRSLALFWGFPNQLSSDSWVVGFAEADPCSALDCETTNGSGSKIFCPGEKVMWAAMQQTTGCSLTRFFTDIERESLGVICPHVLATGTSYTSALTDAKSGVFDRIFKLLASDADNEYMMIDASIVRAHQHSAGARKKTARKRSADRAAVL